MHLRAPVACRLCCTAAAMLVPTSTVLQQVWSVARGHRCILRIKGWPALPAVRPPTAHIPPAQPVRGPMAIHAMDSAPGLLFIHYHSCFAMHRCQVGAHKGGCMFAAWPGPRWPSSSLQSNIHHSTDHIGSAACDYAGVLRGQGFHMQ
jgi:hypothetical protein